MASAPSASSSLQEQPSKHVALAATSSMQRIAEKSSMADVAVPLLLREGVQMTKVSPGKQKSYKFQLDPDQGQIIWQSKKLRISMCADLGDSSLAMLMHCTICSPHREYKGASFFV
jgi:phosphatidylinositol phospholipase C delta